MAIQRALVVCAAAGLLLAGCASARERGVKQDIASFPAAHERRSETTAAGGASKRAKTRSEATDEADDLAHYVATAMENSPALRAAFERYEARVSSISAARKLPDPELSFGYFVRSVETRVGPQRARLGIRQAFPWPTRLTAGADAAAARARAEQERVEALALEVRRKVETAYYQLWFIREARRIHAEHLVVVRSLSESVLARVATGSTTLADQQQVALTAARLDDMLRGMDEAEIVAIAQLHQAMGVDRPRVPETRTQPPPAALPAEDEKSLAQAVKDHPLVTVHGRLAESKDEQARAEKAERLPTFSLGADWIITDEAPSPDVEGSGKDAVIVGGGLSIPLWQGIHGDRVDAARAEAKAERSEQRAAEDRAVAELKAALSAVRDARRRAELYEHTLVPQAETAYVSTLGAYTTGKGTVAQTLLAQKDLLELRAELAEARATHATAWTRLESIVGREVAARTSSSTPEKKPDDLQ